MASVTSTLKMIDAMTPVLKSITSSLNLTLSAMRDMQGAMDKSFDSKQIDAARRSVQQAEAAIRQMTTEIDKAKKAQENLNRTVNQGKEDVEDFARSVLSAVGAFYLFDRARDLLTDLIKRGVDFHAFMQSATVAMTTMLGSAEEAKRYLDELYAFAKTTPFAFPDLVTAGRNLIAFGMDARNTIPVLKAIGDAAAAVGGGTREMMAIADVFGAIQVAGKLSLQEVNRLHTHGIPALKILANQAGVTADEMRKLISKGAIDANVAIASLVKGMQEGTDGLAGQTARMAGMMAELKNTWAGAIDSLKAAWRNAGTEITEKHFPKLISAIHTLTEYVRRIPDIVGPAIDFLVNAATWVGNNWAWIEPIVYTLIAAIGVLTTVLIANALAWLGLNKAMLLNPYVWVISLIVALIVWIVKLWHTNDNFAAALMRAWNLILNMGDKLQIGMYRVVNGIISAFDTMKVTILNIVEALVNGVINGINWLIDKLNQLPGVSLQAMEQVSFASRAAAIADVRRRMREYQLQQRIAEAEKRAWEREVAVRDFLSSRMAARAKLPTAMMSAEQLQLTGALADGLKSLGDIGKMIKNGTGKIDKVGKVGSVGKIEDTVDISSEDLKLMRELAEMKSIQNFVTLTPTVNVTTGDIRNDADIDTIIRRIEETLEREIAASAQGVYG